MYLNLGEGIKHDDLVVYVSLLCVLCESPLASFAVKREEFNRKVRKVLRKERRSKDDRLYL